MIQEYVLVDRLHCNLSLVIICCGIGLGEMVHAQNSTANSTRPVPRPRTDPSEARAVNTIFSQWGLRPSQDWNISGELCSGVAIDATTLVNPGIKCDCSYSNNTICHIFSLAVSGMNVAGPLPAELWGLTYLINLNLAQNYLTGPIPSSIHNLTRIQYLSLSINALSGEVPGEIGQLSNLIVLAFSTNNFSGALPRELGNLSRLEQIYIDSAGFSGPIPSTWANLRSLQTMWASDNEFTGQMPEFIGNWTNMTSLRFQGNSFQGSIPLSFAALTSLTQLRISDLSNGSSSLAFLRNMNSLTSLVLRNNNISGAIPSFFSGFQSLSVLDLSFNSLTGIIPDYLFNLTSLTHLFLGNNMFTGALPLHKRPNILTADLSYNQLSGRFPSWVSQQNLQLNLVANNFTVNSTNSSGLPSGLECLQRNFPCNRGSPIYSSFAIKCGGMEIRPSDRILYERDNETLGPATYYMTGSGRWAVSNSGLPYDSQNASYISSITQPVTNTLDTQLFQTARVSAGSLRYYGLGLENGNYTLRLQFADTSFTNDRTWQSVGRRVFDIYVQGNLVARDFDIRREADGISLRAVSRTFTAQVRDNYIEIHLFWSGKGTCCVPLPATYGPSISTILATPDFSPTVRNNPSFENTNRSSSNHTRIIVGIVVAVGAASLLFLGAYCYVYQKRRKQKNFEDEELLGIDARPYTFTYAELRAATEDFSPANKLGEGGFGPVYKGILGDGRVIAVKQLLVASNHGKSQFIAEIATISAVQHKNLVKLYGCCIEGVKRLLVYEYLENKSLDQLLFGIAKDNCSYLDWPRRYDICLGVAKGLTYLHEESRLRIVHRDVKASNILLDSDFTPKISDFGLAKLYDDKKTHISTKVAGTRGYLAPEYAMLGHLTEKADIFSFGVVVLEMISGRSNCDLTLEDDKVYLLEWVWDLQENNKQIELVDPTLDGFDEVVVKRIISAGLLCTQASPGLRPPMSRVVAMLTGDIEVPSVTTRPGYLTDWKFSDATFMSEIDASSTSIHADSSDTNMPSGTTTFTNTTYSPINPETPMLS